MGLASGQLLYLFAKNRALHDLSNFSSLRKLGISRLPGQGAPPLETPFSLLIKSILTTDFIVISFAPASLFLSVLQHNSFQCYR